MQCILYLYIILNSKMYFYVIVKLFKKCFKVSQSNKNIDFIIPNQ